MALLTDAHTIFLPSIVSKLTITTAGSTATLMFAYHRSIGAKEGVWVQIAAALVIQFF